MKILVYANGTLSVAAQEVKISAAIAELGHEVYLVYNSNKKLFDVGKLPTHKNLHILEEPNYRYDPYLIQDHQFDACLGMDQSVAPFVAEFKDHHKDVFSACMFLDYPVHVVDDTTSYSYDFNYSQRFYYWMSCALTLDKVIFNNTVAVDRFKKKFKRDAALVWYCVTQDQHEVKSAEKQDYVVACNRLIGYKGTDYLVDALARTDYKYVHISVSGNLKDRFIKRCNDSLSGRHLLIERCDEDKKMDILAGAKVCVYPQVTEWIGGLGILEAMSVKTPGVCFDYPVLRELYGDCVLYAQRMSSRDLRRKIIELYENPELYKELQEKGYQRFKENFTRKKMAENIINVLEYK